ncbi:uncharacterized protein F4822DRAFT_445952 [Hypoxylon trugodes]|uniref:uncharacterized protein n=1 Tax=Hypoxylon trugodes TaxID=326681 RepID=UPI0021967889|nr:uncharacterized protein F4822DRAFT_445952 [Hypoxylon trugodes]KAI1384637.1 hypothetical protein F4822DRAFT_445952 [Hypoxylon trugodes]
MAEPMILIPGVIDLSTRVANSFTEFLKSVKNAPKVVRDITLGANTLKGILETLDITLSEDAGGNRRRRMEGINVPILTQAPPNALSHTIKWSSIHQTKAEELRDELERHKSQLSLAIQTDTAMNLNTLSCSMKSIEANLDENAKRTILAWVQPAKIDMREFHSEQCNKREVGTCEWMTETEGWKQWLDGGSIDASGYRRFIWIYGIPGAGKTVLASYLIDTIATHCCSIGYSYYYCHNERNQDETMHLLRWIVSDLSRQAGRFIPQKLEELRHKGDFTIASLLDCFLAISRQIAQRGKRVYLVVDAIDESRRPRERLLDVLIKIGTDESFDHVSLLMTSREEPDIKDKMTMVEEGRDRDTNSMEVDQIADRMIDGRIPYTPITMENGDVMKAIRTYVRKQLNRNEKLCWWSKDFREEVEEQLARNARGMFRWVACQLDIINRNNYTDEDGIRETLADLPETLFDTYERILNDIPREQRDFAHTALVLICSNTANIKCAEVLVQACLHNVRYGAMHMYSVGTLRDTLGCLIKVTDLKKKLPTVFRRDDEVLPHQKVSIAHYTVREFLFAPAKEPLGPRPAKEFALTDVQIRTLEVQTMFDGLQQFGLNLNRHQRCPSRYEEHCLEMTDLALRDRRSLIVEHRPVWKSVINCLIPGSMHLKALTNGNLRRRYLEWGTLCAYIEPPETQIPIRANKKGHEMTSIIAALMLLRWPELARNYLKGQPFDGLTPEAKRAVWSNKFSINSDIDERLPRTPIRSERVTLLQLCVLWKRLDFLELFIEVGADFINEPGIVFTALRPSNPHEGHGRSDGSVTGQLLKMLLERGANPNPRGFRYTPLQYATYLLEESWVQSLLLENGEAALTGDPNGKHPFEVADAKQGWYRRCPLEICKNARPEWPDQDDADQLIEKARRQVGQLLRQYGARTPPNSAARPVESSRPARLPRTPRTNQPIFVKMNPP